MIAGVGLLLAIATAFVLSRQLPASGFNMTPTAGVSTVAPIVSTSTFTSTPAPTLTARATATETEEVPTAALPPGNADKIAFVAGNQIYLMNVDGTDLIQILTDNSAKTNLQWMSDGRLVFVSRNCANIIDVETRNIQELVCFNPNEVLEGFSVSPDGKWMAISIQRTLNILPFNPDLLEGVETRFSLALLFLL